MWHVGQSHPLWANTFCPPLNPHPPPPHHQPPPLFSPRSRHTSKAPLFCSFRRAPRFSSTTAAALTHSLTHFIFFIHHPSTYPPSVHTVFFLSSSSYSLTPSHARSHSQIPFSLSLFFSRITNLSSSCHSFLFFSAYCVFDFTLFNHQSLIPYLPPLFSPPFFPVINRLPLSRVYRVKSLRIDRRPPSSCLLQFLTTGSTTSVLFHFFVRTAPPFFFFLFLHLTPTSGIYPFISFIPNRLIICFFFFSSCVAAT